MVSDRHSRHAALLHETFQSALRFAVVSDELLTFRTSGEVSIRFEVRGGFRHVYAPVAHGRVEVSIRFEVRGGFRRLP